MATRGGPIKLEHAIAFVKEYKKLIIDSHPPIKTDPETISCWFSIEEIKSFIANIEKHAGTGIRMYMGIITDIKDEPHSNVGQKTVILVGTKPVKTTGMISFDEDIIISDGINDFVANHLLWEDPFLCPPNCDGAKLKALAHKP